VNWIVTNLWLVPALPLLAAGISSLAQRRHRSFAANLAVGSMLLAFFLSCAAFVQTLGAPEQHFTYGFGWFAMGETSFRLGWVLDPLTAAMLVMITFVGTLIFVFSVGYMAGDENFTRFFCFLSLFAAAMLGLVIANNLLMLFMCWELVGLASYLLIGFWYHKPSAAAAAKKAFITTRIGDLGFFLGLLWLYAETGTLLFYDGGAGCLEQGALAKLVGQVTLGGMAVSTAVALLLFCGAIGKSGQVPLHVWLPDAMEGPTPVSALIHAATMVAAGVFLVARVYPLMAVVPLPPAALARAAALEQRSTPAKAQSPPAAGAHEVEKKSDGAPEAHGAKPSGAAPGEVAAPLRAVAWVGAITAVFAALIAVAQTDIKRILAYSTVSQLGFMFIGLGVGGVAVGMFHLLTHAFFKALLFLGSGSVIHGCHDEQDIRVMGGLRRYMPVTFVTYAIGMMALSGVPLFFSGFWSKDEILHAAWVWPGGQGPFVLAICGALLTAFYMTRQMLYVFFGPCRLGLHQASGQTGDGAMLTPAGGEPGASHSSHQSESSKALPHESPPVMTVPLAILAVCVVLLSVFGTPVFPWFHSYLSGHETHVQRAVDVGALLTMLLSTLVVASGIWLGWRVYGRTPLQEPKQLDPLESWSPDWFDALRRKFGIDELYEMSVVRLNAWCAGRARWLDDVLWSGGVLAVAYLVLALSWLSRLFDEFVVNFGFDQGCGGLRLGARVLGLWQNGQVQRYLKVIALALAALAVLFLWSR